MVFGYKYRCSAKTLKGTRCKLANSYTGEFCHVHAPGSKSSIKKQFEIESSWSSPPETEYCSSDSEDDTEYNPCSKRYSPQYPRNNQRPGNSQDPEIEANKLFEEVFGGLNEGSELKKFYEGFELLI